MAVDITLLLDDQPGELARVGELLGRAGISDVASSEFRRYGSARQLYSFQVDNAV